MAQSTNAQSHNFDTLTSHPIHPAALKALAQLPAYAFLDPTKLYHESRSARVLLDSARASIAQHFQVQVDEVSFVPSGTAGIDLIISGLLNALSNKTVIYGTVEQAAIVQRVANFENYPIEADNLGRINVESYVNTLETKKPGLAVLQFANHEVGTQQNLNPIYKKFSQNLIEISKKFNNLEEFNSLKEIS